MPTATMHCNTAASTGRFQGNSGGSHCPRSRCPGGRCRRTGRRLRQQPGQVVAEGQNDKIGGLRQDDEQDGPRGAAQARLRHGNEPGDGQRRHQHQEVEAAKTCANQQRPARQPTGPEPSTRPTALVNVQLRPSLAGEPKNGQRRDSQGGGAGACAVNPGRTWATAAKRSPRRGY